MKLRRKSEPKPEIPLAPMIDCVFLLMVYFIVTVSAQVREMQISFQLPGGVGEAQVDFQDEQIIAIHGNGEVWWNGYCYGNAAGEDFAELRSALSGLRAMSMHSEGGDGITIAPDDQVLHQWIVTVMNIIQSVGIKNIYFSSLSRLE
jgi:biopolymer transport protein ExbD